jgi:hypothetical protein
MKLKSFIRHFKKWEFYRHHYYKKKGAMASVPSVLTLNDGVLKTRYKWNGYS